MRMTFFKPFLIGVLASVAAIYTAFLLLNYYRVSGFDASLLEACSHQVPEQISACVAWTVSAYMGDRHWLAVQFVCYTLLALVPGWMLGARLPDVAVRAGLLLGVSAALVLILVLEPGRLPALAALFGSVLGGLMATSRWRRRSLAGVR